MKAHARVVARLDMASRPTSARVTLDRELGLFHVRPHRRRRVYTLPLGTVAELVVRSILRAEVAERKRRRPRASARRR